MITTETTKRAYGNGRCAVKHGISRSASGRLTLDQSKLDQALATSLRDVEGLLRGLGGKDGIFSELRDRLKRNGGAAGFVVPPRDGVRAASSNLRQTQQYLGRSEDIVKRAVSGLNKSNAVFGRISMRVVS